MQRKIIVTQIAILGLTMVFGALLKSDAIEQARLLHRSFAILALVSSLISMIIFVSQKAPRKEVIFVVLAFAATVGASAGGNITRTSLNNVGYMLMISSFVVAVVASGLALTSLARHPKTPLN
jgi:cytochrome b subunit of formate dehydrogenase